MKIDKDQSYKLVEFQGGFAIVNGGTKVNMPHAQDLCLASRNDLCEYLATYLANREAGKKPREAHELALTARGIQKVIQL